MVHLAVTTAPEMRFVNLNGPQLQQLRQANRVESAAAMDGWNLTTTEGDLPKTFRLCISLPTLSTFLACLCCWGGLLPSGCARGPDPENVAVLGYQFWQRHTTEIPVLSARKSNWFARYEIVV